MNTNERRYTARELLGKVLPEGGEWRVRDDALFWHKRPRSFMINSGVAFTKRGAIKSTIASLDSGIYSQDKTIPRSTAIDLMVQGIEAGEVSQPTPSTHDCCKGWATDDLQADMLGNGHHHNCQHYKANVGAVALLKRLVDGIKWWADQEDGVPDEVWEAYKEAVFIADGRVLNDGDEAGEVAGHVTEMTNAEAEAAYDEQADAKPFTKEEIERYVKVATSGKIDHEPTFDIDDKVQVCSVIGNGDEDYIDRIGTIVELAENTVLVDFGGDEWWFVPECLKLVEVATPDPYAHLPHGGEWFPSDDSETLWWFGGASVDGRAIGVTFNADGTVHGPAIGPKPRCLAITRAQAIAIIEQHKAKQEQPAPAMGPHDDLAREWVAKHHPEYEVVGYRKPSKGEKIIDRINGGMELGHAYIDFRNQEFYILAPKAKDEPVIVDDNDGMPMVADPQPRNTIDRDLFELVKAISHGAGRSSNGGNQADMRTREIMDLARKLLAEIHSSGDLI